MMCEQIEELEVIKAFNSPQTLLEELPAIDFDLLITDIEMPGMNGLQIADAVKDKAIIFTTAYKDFAVDAFDRNAADYIVKPVKADRLRQAVEKVAERLHRKEKEAKQIVLNTDKGKALINSGKIFSINTSDIDSRDKVLLLNDGTKVTAKNSSFEKLMEMLPPNEFCRINKKAVIALKHVQYYSHDEIISDIMTQSNKPYTFPLSEIYRAEFIRMVKAK